VCARGPGGCASSGAGVRIRPDSPSVCLEVVRGFLRVRRRRGFSVLGVLGRARDGGGEYPFGDHGRPDPACRDVVRAKCESCRAANIINWARAVEGPFSDPIAVRRVLRSAVHQWRPYRRLRICREALLFQRTGVAPSGRFASVSGACEPGASFSRIALSFGLSQPDSVGGRTARPFSD